MGHKSGARRTFRIAEGRMSVDCAVCGEHIPAGEPHKIYDVCGKRSHACSTCDIGYQLNPGPRGASGGVVVTVARALDTFAKAAVPK